MRDSNALYTKNEVFKKACELADTPVTIRQASKYRRNKGLASRFMKKATILINQETDGTK